MRNTSERLTMPDLIEAAASCSICFKGEEYKKGHTLLHAGTKIDAAALAVASGNGIMELPVYRRVKAAVVSSGSEQIDPRLSSGKRSFFP